MARLGVCLAVAAGAVGCGSDGGQGVGPAASTPAAGADDPSAVAAGAAPSAPEGGSGEPTSTGGEGSPGGISLDGPAPGATPAGDPPEPGDPALIPFQLEVPPLAFDESSIVLVWHKPDNYADVVDYHVYRDGERLGSAIQNNTELSPAKPYIDGFYAADTAGFHARATTHNYTVTGLEPGTDYRFTARSVLPDGTESADSNVVVQRTLDRPVVLDVSAPPYGALGDGTTLNTAAIPQQRHVVNARRARCVV